jgi:hypothetical protein
MDGDGQAEPERDDDDRAPDAQSTKPVQHPGHVDNLSPDPDQPTCSGSGHQNKRNIVGHGRQSPVSMTVEQAQPRHR